MNSTTSETTLKNKRSDHGVDSRKREDETSQPTPKPPPFTGAGLIAPYVGATGFMNSTEVMHALSCIPANSNRKAMIGVLVSSGTMRGKPPTRFIGRYPDVAKVNDIFIDHSLAFNVVHYSTSDKTNLAGQLSDVVALAPDLIQGIQLNMVWPEPHAIRSFRAKYPNVKIILQVGTHAFQRVESRPLMLVEKLRFYKGIVDFVLLDDSGGIGKALDSEFLLPFVQSVVRAHLDMRIVIAGGLCKDNLHLINDVVEACPDVSIDAEGKLRDDEKDCLDMPVVKAYLISAFEFFVHP